MYYFTPQKIDFKVRRIKKFSFIYIFYKFATCII